MTTSITNEYTSLQKYNSLTLYFRKGGVLLCVRDEWRQGQTAILTQVLLLTIAALLSHLGWGCSTVRHWEPQSLQSASWFSRWHSCLNWPTAADTLSIFFLNVHLLPLFFGLFTQVRLLIDGSVEGQYITICIYRIPVPNPDIIQGQFLSGVKQVWIQSFLYPKKQNQIYEVKTCNLPCLYSVKPTWLFFHGSKFCVSSQVRQETLEESRRTHRSKRCEYNNEDEDNNSNTLMIKKKCPI